MSLIDTKIANRYHVKSLVKRGNSNLIWLAVDEVLGREVIMKQRIDLRVDLDDKYKHLESDIPVDVAQVFENEARMLASLEHPHLLPIYDFGTHDKQAYLVMRYLPQSRSIVDYYNQNGMMSTEDILRLMGRLASALDYLHNRDIVHGDVTPANVLLGDQLHPYLHNLVVASTNQALRDMDSDEIVGSPPYIAPETYMGQVFAPAVDQFALGVTLYQMFTEQLPFEGDLPLAIAQIRALNTGNTTHISVRKKRPDLPIGVDIILNRMTSYDPDDRYPSIQDAIDALNQVFYSGQTSIDGTIFISYARKDRDYVYSLAQDMRRVGLDIWIDQDIEPGSNWDDAIEGALNDCDIMLLITTDASMSSEYVTHEWSYFMGGGKPVYPFIPSEPIPSNIHPRLQRIQHVVGTDDMLNNVARIVDVLAGGTPTKLG
ncbi:MAG: TIR domain-containing protein [Chloroflexota bacterium]